MDGEGGGLLPGDIFPRWRKGFHKVCENLARDQKDRLRFGRQQYLRVVQYMKARVVLHRLYCWIDATQFRRMDGIL